MSLGMMNLADLENVELIRLRAMLDKEMSNRGLSVSVGELGEKLAVDFFNSRPGLPNLIEAPKGAKNIDALSRDGERYSIKTQLKAKKTGTIYPDEIKPDKQLFEHLLVVRLSPEYELDAIYRYSWESFLSVRSWDKRMNAWYVSLSKKKLLLSERIFAAG